MPNMLTRKEKSYLAGIIDGEGSIMLLHQPAKSRGTFTPKLAIANTNFRLIDWLVREFPNSTINCRDDRPKSKPVYQWQVYNENA